jgi:hypothetical protein
MFRVRTRTAGYSYNETNFLLGDGTKYVDYTADVAGIYAVPFEGEVPP